ncbi:hypothetical protein C8T65DRAFT_583741, partial [Cerioporus squamosus]
MTNSQRTSVNSQADCDVQTEASNANTVHIYSVREGSTASHASKPFITRFGLCGKDSNDTLEVSGLVDSGAMVNVMDLDLWCTIRARLCDAEQSARRLRMANGVYVQSEGRWKGTFKFGTVEVLGDFEIFPSGGAWSFLLGKPMLESLKAIHNFENDTVLVRDG